MAKKDRSVKIVGFEEKSGMYEDRPYHNVYFHCTKNFTGEANKGLKVSIIKVKYDVLSECFDKDLSFNELSILIGQDIEFKYDENGSVIDLEPVDTKSEEKK